MVEPTNTLILTGFSDEELQDTDLVKMLQQQILANTPSDETIKFTILKSFRRILIAFERIESSVILYKILKKVGITVGFSAQNNYDDFILTEDGYKFDTKEYLHLPAHGTTFIISPPPSPPPGWKSTTEEAPNERSIYSPKELSDLLYKRIDEDRIQKMYDENGEENDDLKNDHNKVVEQKIVLQESGLTSPIIILEAPSDDESDFFKRDRLIKPSKVSLPPL